MSIEDYYNIEKVLGEGTFGRVYLVQSKMDGQKYALKILKRNDNVENEYNAIRAISYFPNCIPSIVCYRDMRGSIFEGQVVTAVLMEYIPGEILFNYFLQNRSEEKILSIMYNLFGALNYMHKRNVYHRDIKPDNILINPERVAFIDLGLSCLIYQCNNSLRIFFYYPNELDNQQGDVFALALTLLMCLIRQRETMITDNLYTTRGYFVYQFMELYPSGLVKDIILRCLSFDTPSAWEVTDFISKRAPSVLANTSF